MLQAAGAPHRLKLGLQGRQQVPLYRNVSYLWSAKGRLVQPFPTSQPVPKRAAAAVRVAAAAVSLDAGAPVPSSVSQKPVPWLSTVHDAEIRAVAVPALVSMLLEPIMGVFNSALVARLGTQQLGAVSVASLAISFCTFLFSFLLFLTTPEIAAAVVKGDRAEVSRISAKGFWVAGVFGVTASVTMLLGGPAIIAVMNPPEAEVARYAVDYIGARAPGVVAALLGFVATGTYRGWKDTRTPLYAAVGSAATSLALNYVFIYVLGLGVYGSGLATTIAQYVSCGALCVLLVRKDMLRLSDLARPPSLEAVLPLLRKGAVLAVRNIISFGMILYASTLCVRAGSAYQASFEVVRQVWILTIQFFECLNVAAQTLCAAYLGGGDVRSADEVLQRLLFLGVVMGGLVGLVVAAGQVQITAFFTRDVAVISQVLLTLPMVAVLFPMDAAASIMDGSLLAAKQTDYLSYVQIVGSVVQYFGLIWLAANARIDNLSIWAVLKLLTVFRLVGGWYRNYCSPLSAYKEAAVKRVEAGSPSSPAVPSTSQPADATAANQQPPLHSNGGIPGPLDALPPHHQRSPSQAGSVASGAAASSSSSSNSRGDEGTEVSGGVPDSVLVMAVAVEDPAASGAALQASVRELEAQAWTDNEGDGRGPGSHSMGTQQGGVPASASATAAKAG